MREEKQVMRSERSLQARSFRSAAAHREGFGFYTGRAGKPWRIWSRGIYMIYLCFNRTSLAAIFRAGAEQGDQELFKKPGWGWVGTGWLSR